MEDILTKKSLVAITLLQYTMIKYSKYLGVSILLSDNSVLDVAFEDGLSYRHYFTLDEFLKDYNYDVEFDDISFPEFPEVVKIKVWEW